MDEDQYFITITAYFILYKHHTQTQIYQSLDYNMAKSTACRKDCLQRELVA